MTDTIEKPAASSPEKFGALVPVAKPQSDKDWQDTFVACFEKMDSDNEAEAIDAFRKARHISRRIGTPFLSILKYEELRAINKQLGAQNVQLRREMAEMSRIVNRYTWLMNFGDVGKRARAHIKKYPFEYLIAATYASAYAFTGFCVEDILGFTGSITGALGGAASIASGGDRWLARHSFPIAIAGAVCFVLGITIENNRNSKLDALVSLDRMIQIGDLGPRTATTKNFLRSSVHVVTYQGKHYSLAIGIDDKLDNSTSFHKTIDCTKYWKIEKNVTAELADKIGLVPDTSKKLERTVGDCDAYDAIIKQGPRP